MPPMQRLPVPWVFLSLLLLLLLTFPVLLLGFQLPDTGQEKCYNHYQEISCPKAGKAYYGQDGNYRGPRAAYRDNHDGTVTDLKTGLTWQQGDQQNDCPYGCYTWKKAKDYCANLKLGGNTDWRLPTRLELLSLLDYSPLDLLIDTHYFPDCNWQPYWSASSYAENSEFAWHISFREGGYTYWFKKTFSNSVRCVRGGA